MGTSQSKPDARPGASLVPAWAAADPAATDDERVQASEDGSNEAADHDAPGEGPPKLNSPEGVLAAPPRRYAAFRSALGRFARSGSRDEARNALGHWARTSRGGATSGTQRLSRAIRAGGAALAGIARAAAAAPSFDDALDVRSLAGLPFDVAIGRIVDAFCPPGILDDDLSRLAIAESLAATLGGVDTFDPAALDTNAIQVATLTFAGELVFLSVAGDGGRALAAAPTPALAIQREADVRSLIREVTDVVGTPLFAASGPVLSPASMTALVARLVEAVQQEMSTW